MSETDPVPSRRVALVVGVGAYETARKLVAPPGDAARIGQLLQSLGFRIIPALNCSYHEFRDALRKFNGELRGADIGLFYFSGHGVQDVSRENFLLPADAELHEPEDLSRWGFSLRRIMADMHDRVETGLIFLDACRDNPFDGEDLPGTKSVATGGSGLARPKGSLGGLLVAYASDEDNVALDGSGDAPSPFTAALLRHLPVPGRSITSALIDVSREVQEATAGRQTPWTQASLKKDVVLLPSDKAPTAGQGQDQTPKAQTSEGTAPLPGQTATRQPEPPLILQPPEKPSAFRLVARILVLALVLAVGLAGLDYYRSLQKVPAPLVDVCADPGPDHELACRVPDLNNADETIRLATAKDLEVALLSPDLSVAQKAAIVARLLDLAEADSFARLSPDGRFNVLARLAGVPAELWLDPAMIGELERAHRTIATLIANETRLLGSQTGAFLEKWSANTGFRPRSKVTVYPHFAGYAREDFRNLMQALAMGWGWQLEALDEEAGAAGRAQVRYGNDGMRPLALLMAAQLGGRIPPHSGDASVDAKVSEAIAEAGLGQVDVAKIRMKDGQLEIWIGQ